MDLIAFCCQDEPFDDILQLPDIAGPRVLHQHGEGVGLQELSFSQFLIEPAKLSLDELQNVLGSVSESRYADRSHVETVVEVVSQLPGSDQLHDVSACGGYDPDIHRNVANASHALDHAFPYDPEDLDLRILWKSRDLIEKNRAAFRSLENTLVAFGSRSRKGSAYVSEEFGFNHSVGDGIAVDVHEWLVGSLTLIVERFRDPAFAYSGFSREEDRRINGG